VHSLQKIKDHPEGLIEFLVLVRDQEERVAADGQPELLRPEDLDLGYVFHSHLVQDLPPRFAHDHQVDVREDCVASLGGVRFRVHRHEHHRAV
jgi:hypothetical protein